MVSVPAKLKYPPGLQMASFTQLHTNTHPHTLQTDSPHLPNIPRQQAITLTVAPDCFLKSWEVYADIISDVVQVVQKVDAGPVDVLLNVSWHIKEDGDKQVVCPFARLLWRLRIRACELNEEMRIFAGCSDH